ncbi:MAG: hypothetical protein IJM64_04340 [Ottowia sp.]|nr:hypothetical protein [Ottowia sp.]MBQ9579048.1 hypothetical protein [Ottowia sp.]
MTTHEMQALHAAPLATLLARFAPHVRIAHHIPGRVRLRLDAAALKEAGISTGALRPKGAWTDDGALPGVRRVSWNLLARSCTIEYDAVRIAPAAWPELLAGRDTPAAAALRALLQQAQQRALAHEAAP